MKYLIVLFLCFNLKAYADEIYQSNDIKIYFSDFKNCFYISGQEDVENVNIISLGIKSDDVKVSNYDASNIFGAKRIVNKMEGEKVYDAIKLPSILRNLQSDKCLSFLGDNHEDKFEASIEFYQTADGELKETWYQTPTFTNPNERDITTRYQLKKFKSITFLKNGKIFIQLTENDRLNEVLSKVIESKFKIENTNENYDVILNCEGGWNNPDITDDAILFKKDNKIEVLYTDTDYDRSRIYKNVVLELNQGFNFIDNMIMYYYDKDLVVFDMNRLAFEITENGNNYFSKEAKFLNLNPPFYLNTHGEAESLSQVYKNFNEFNLNRESLDLKVKAERNSSYDTQTHTYDCKIIDSNNLTKILKQRTEKDSKKFLKKFNKYLLKIEKEREKLESQKSKNKI